MVGLVLGLAVASATYFNDNVINQTMLIGNHLPIGVLGVAVIVLLVVNPLLRVFGSGWPLRGGEVGLVVAIGLASCGWPGSGFFRGFSPVSAMPAHWLKTKADWQAVDVMSYVPGGAAELAPGQVQDWRGFLTGLDSPEGEAQRLVSSRLSRVTAQGVSRALADGAVDVSERRQLRRLLNRDLISRTGQGATYRVLEEAGLLPASAEGAMGRRAALLARAAAVSGTGETAEAAGAAGEGEVTRAAGAGGGEDDWRVGYWRREAEKWGRHANRAVWVGVLGQWGVLPLPAGGVVVVGGGRADRYVTDTFVQGTGSGEGLSLVGLPWEAWWPPIRLWWSLALLTGLGLLCLTLVVHPQWSRRELLPYPIARFVEEAVDRRPGAWLPTVAHEKLFWLAFAGLVGLHGVNGLHAWFEYLPQIPLGLDFSALRTLFPTASRVWGADTYFRPTLYLSVIAFSFFLTTSVSLSLGVSQLLFLMLTSAMLLQGVAVEHDAVAGGNVTLLRFGGYVGLAVMIGYTGRRYYLNVLMSSVGWPRAKETPRYATWAARGLVVTTVLSVVVMRSAGLDWLMALVVVGLVLLLHLVLTRIVVETGVFFVQATWMPVGVLTALLGFEAIGPTTYIVMALASMMLVSEPREALMPYLANGLRIADRTSGGGPARVSVWLALMVVASLVVAGCATLYFQYRHGMGGVDAWTRVNVPTMPFDYLSKQVSQASAEARIEEAVSVGPLERLSEVSSSAGSYRWAGLGLALVVGCAVARLRLPWWPLHPVAFLLWGTYPMVMFGFSFLLGWLVKSAVVRTAGAKGYHRLKPLMIGIIAGELVSGLLWMGVGAVYYFVTGKPPAQYWIFPA